jgi:DNA-binding MarR family transcriptional regulator
MRIGNDEKLVYSLLTKYPGLSRNNLQVLFTFVSNKKRDTGKIIQSLQLKRLVDKSNHTLKSTSIKTENLLVDIIIDDEILRNIDNLSEFAKLGKPAKMILYILAQIKKSSLQFLADTLGQSTHNTYAVLKRLEEKNLVYSYNSKIYHLNTRGRRFNPKYYVATDLGKIVAKIKANSMDLKQIDTMLESTKAEIESMHRVFRVS